jgi:hypothetical protein
MLMTLVMASVTSSALMLSPTRSALSPRPLSMQLRNAAADITDVVFLGENLQIFVDTEDEEEGSLWAEATVNSIDSDSGEFMVKVTEWDSLPKEDAAYEAAYEEGPFTAGEEGEEWRRGVELWDPGRDASGVDVGDSLQIFVDTEDEEAGSVWAAATVTRIDSDSGEFMVKVTEWDSLPKDDPAYEVAYEEGPFTAGEEEEEWRRPASAAPAAAAPRVIATTPSPEEAAAVVAVASAAANMKRCGVDGDESEWPQLAAAVEALYVALYNVGQPIATDRRLVGDWQLIGCTSPEVSRRKGLTGLGAAVFTKLGALHYSFAADGSAVARETLEFFGKPVILNELRGTLSFSADGRSMQEEYTEADMGGQQSTSVFSGSFSTLTASVISTDGTLRIGRGPDGVLVFRKLPPGGLAAWLEDQLLPSDGGTYLGNPTWKGPMERA